MKNTLIISLAGFFLVAPGVLHASSDLMNERHQELREFARQTNQAFHDDLLKTREGLQTKLAGERATLKIKLAAIKDKRKKEIVERIADRLTGINNNVVDHFTLVL